MLRALHELNRGDRFEFVDPRLEKTESAKGLQTVVSCWGVRPPGGRPLNPWMLSCRDSSGVVRNYVLPAALEVVWKPV